MNSHDSPYSIRTYKKYQQNASRTKTNASFQSSQNRTKGEVNLSHLFSHNSSYQYNKNQSQLELMVESRIKKSAIETKQINQMLNKLKMINFMSKIKNQNNIRISHLQSSIKAKKSLLTQLQEYVNKQKQRYSKNIAKILEKKTKIKIKKNNLYRCLTEEIQVTKRKIRKLQQTKVTSKRTSQKVFIKQRSLKQAKTIIFIPILFSKQSNPFQADHFKDNLRQSNKRQKVSTHYCRQNFRNIPCYNNYMPQYSKNKIQSNFDQLKLNNQDDFKQNLAQLLLKKFKTQQLRKQQPNLSYFDSSSQSLSKKALKKEKIDENLIVQHSFKNKKNKNKNNQSQEKQFCQKSNQKFYQKQKIAILISQSSETGPKTIQNQSPNLYESPRLKKQISSDSKRSYVNIYLESSGKRESSSEKQDFYDYYIKSRRRSVQPVYSKTEELYSENEQIIKTNNVALQTQIQKKTEKLYPQITQQAEDQEDIIQLINLKMDSNVHQQKYKFKEGKNNKQIGISKFDKKQIINEIDEDKKQQFQKDFTQSIFIKQIINQFESIQHNTQSQDIFEQDILDCLQNSTLRESTKSKVVKKISPIKSKSSSPNRQSALMKSSLLLNQPIQETLQEDMSSLLPKKQLQKIQNQDSY